MLLYDMRTAMNPRRVRIFLAEKGISLPVQQVDGSRGENKSPEFLKINSLGKLPVLQLDDGSYLTESIAICRYLESIYPEKPMLGTGALEQARIEMWIRRLESEIVLPITQAFRHTGDYWVGKFPQLPASGQWWRERATESFAWLEQELGDREYVASESYSVADIVLQCALIVGRATGTPIPDACPRLQAWYAKVCDRPTARA